MRKWQPHKIVEAEPITDFSRSLSSVIAGEKVVVPFNFFSRGEPKIGDYLVRYDDGYLSWSPKKAFEEGYTEVKGGS